MTISKDFEEIYLERLRYLASMDDMIEKMLEERHSIIYDIQADQEMRQGLARENGIRADAELVSA